VSGSPIVFQALINMAVLCRTLPVTGQTCLLIKKWGTSSWMTVAIGIILSASNKHAQSENEELDELKPL